MTLEWMKRCGVEFSNENFEHFRVRGRSRWKGFEVTIPLDWSAALYPIAAAVLTPNSDVVLPGLDWQDCQGDKMVVNVLKEMGADIQVTPDGVRARTSRLTGRVIDCNDFIDQFMLLAVMGAFAEGETTLTNAESARYKESDRISEMVRALRAMGAAVEEHPDGLTVRKSSPHGANLDSREDHRLVMTLAVAAMAARGVSTISRIECVKKTFPDFVAQMQGIGADMQVR
jgi:3-phosphoshikimate 1-carboxyvinyltransferase